MIRVKTSQKIIIIIGALKVDTLI